MRASAKSSRPDTTFTHAAVRQRPRVGLSTPAQDGRRESGIKRRRCRVDAGQIPWPLQSSMAVSSLPLPLTHWPAMAQQPPWATGWLMHRPLRPSNAPTIISLPRGWPGWLFHPLPPTLYSDGGRRLDGRIDGALVLHIAACRNPDQGRRSLHPAYPPRGRRSARLMGSFARHRRVAGSPSPRPPCRSRLMMVGEAQMVCPSSGK